MRQANAPTQPHSCHLLDKLVKILRRAKDEDLPVYLSHYEKSTSDFAPTALAAVQAEINARHENEKAA